MAATRDDWKTTPLPAKRVATTLDRTYTGDEFERIREGNVPQEMEDKWFTYFEEPWLYLHRSWTGFGIFEVRFEQANAGVRVAEVLVSREAKEYSGTDVTADSLLLAVLLDRYAGRDSEPTWQQYLKALQYSIQRENQSLYRRLLYGLVLRVRSSLIAESPMSWIVRRIKAYLS